jgi:hypothetical protein
MGEFRKMKKKRDDRFARLLRAKEGEGGVDADSLSLPEAEKPLTHHTVYCVSCDRDVWKVPAGEVIDPKDVEPVGHTVCNDGSLLTDCPFCHSSVFDRRYFGGWEYTAREVGRVPSGSRCHPGVWIPVTHPSPYAR